MTTERGQLATQHTPSGFEGLTGEASITSATGQSVEHTHQRTRQSQAQGGIPEATQTGSTHLDHIGDYTTATTVLGYHESARLPIGSMRDVLQRVISEGQPDKAQELTSIVARLEFCIPTGETDETVGRGELSPKSIRAASKAGKMLITSPMFLANSYAVPLKFAIDGFHKNPVKQNLYEEGLLDRTVIARMTPAADDGYSPSFAIVGDKNPNTVKMAGIFFDPESGQSLVLPITPDIRQAIAANEVYPLGTLEVESNGDAVVSNPGVYLPGRDVESYMILTHTYANDSDVSSRPVSPYLADPERTRAIRGALLAGIDQSAPSPQTSIPDQAETPHESTVNGIPQTALEDDNNSYSALLPADESAYTYGADRGQSSMTSDGVVSFAPKENRVSIDRVLGLFKGKGRWHKHD